MNTRSHRIDDRPDAGTHPPYPAHDYFSRSIPSRAFSRHRPSRRQSWPAYSFVEDEKASLAKEAFPVNADTDNPEVCRRGSIDQEPILVDADETALQGKPPVSRYSNQANRKVKIEEPHRRDIRESKPKRVQMPDSDGELSKTTEFVDFASRHSTPYSFTPMRDTKSSPTDSGYSSSSDLLREKRKQARLVSDATTSDALRGAGKTRERNHQRHLSTQSLDGEAPRDLYPSRNERHINRPPPLQCDLPQREKRESNRDSGAGRPRLAAVKADALHSPRRSSDSATTLPRATLEDTSRSPIASKPPRLATMAARNSTFEKDDDNRSDISSRPGSPTLGPSTFLPSPPRSPVTNNHGYKEEPRNRRSLARASRSESKPVSRATSPVDSMRRSSTFPNLAEERFHRPMRSSDLTFTMDEVSPRDAYGQYPPTPAMSECSQSALPYPVDDMGLMPCEEDHRYRPRIHDGASSPSIPAHRGSASSPISDRHSTTGGAPPSRPRLPVRRTADEALPTLRTSSQIMSDTLTTSPTPMKSPAVNPLRKPPPCARSKSTRDYNDWYTLEGLPDFDICPGCLYSNFDSTRFRDYFRRAKPKEPRQKTKCDFANEWIRLAWLMTQQQQRRDLDLVYAVARIGVQEGHCPGDHDVKRSWYTLVDKNGQKIDRFDVCKTDVRRIEALMPQLHDVFTKAYPSGTEKVRTCDFRTESRRFSKYLDMLYDVVETAEVKRRPPDVQHFVDYVKGRSQLNECRRDEPKPFRLWHFIPQLPEFTVCEECYTDVVWPWIESGFLIANKFQRTPLAFNDDEDVSCQLYSDRMRSVFRKAVKTNDFSYLTFRAQERKRAEKNIKGFQKKQEKLRKQLEAEGVRPSAMSGLLQDLQRSEEDWRKFE